MLGIFYYIFPDASKFCLVKYQQNFMWLFFRSEIGQKSKNKKLQYIK